MKKVLIIAGSDSSGGAGIQADIKTITVHKQFAMTAITALTAQNTTGVSGIFEVSAEFVAAQMDAVFSDIVPDAVKIGMVSSEHIIYTISERLRHYNARGIVVDPVMVSTSGSALISETAKNALAKSLFPLSQLVTPNIPEAEVLCGFQVNNQSDMVDAAQAISKQFSCNVLLKGGHLDGDASDLLLENEAIHWFHGERINNPNNHGTGCTLSSAIACGLADGKSLRESVADAKAYIHGALKAMLDLGAGSGPVNHLWNA